MRLVGFLMSVVLLLVGCGDRSEEPVASTTTVANKTADTTNCPRYRSSVNVGTVRDSRLDELSGLAASAANPGYFWTHNDSGDSARIFLIDKRGDLAAIYDLRGVSALDIEDIAVARGEVWVADTGDNLHFRGDGSIYHFPEPKLGSSDEQTVDVKTLRVDFGLPNSNRTYSVDSEAFFVDHVGNGYLVEKTTMGTKAWLYEIPADQLVRGSSVVAQPVVQIVGNTSGEGVGPTAADMNADGTQLVVKNYRETFEWNFTDESSVVAVLQTQPQAPCVIAAGLGEAIAFDGTSLLSVEEGIGKPLRLTAQR